jgi:hypothetical protein
MKPLKHTRNTRNRQLNLNQAQTKFRITTTAPPPHRSTGPQVHSPNQVINIDLVMKTNIALVIAYAAISIIGFAQADDVDTTSTEQICLPDDNTCVADLGRETQEASIGIENVEIKEGIQITYGDDDDDDDDDDGDDDDEYDDGSVPSKEDSYYDHDDDDDDDFEDEDGIDNCHDEHERCEFWASLNECEKNPGYMLGNCQKSCDTCTKSSPSTVKEGYGAA